MLIKVVLEAIAACFFAFLIICFISYICGYPALRRGKAVKEKQCRIKSSDREETE